MRVNTPKNKLLKIDKNSFFNIPVIFRDVSQTPYLEQLNSKFSRIVKFLDSCIEDDFFPSSKQNLLNEIKYLQKGLILVLTEYLNGHPSSAFEVFCNVLAKSGIDEELKTNQQIVIDRNTNFYRIQQDWNKHSLKYPNKKGFLNLETPLDLFHQPFEKRRSVRSCRFSISGYPSLYLCQNLHSSYSECFPKNDFATFHSVSFRNIRPLYFLDLSPHKLNVNNNKFEGIAVTLDKGYKKRDVTGILEYLKIYQAIISSHTKINYVEYYPNEIFHFKAEYIIPQFMLQWLTINKMPVDGIKYLSCTSKINFPNIDNHYNYVLPVKESLNKGHCPSLSSLFMSSKVYSHLIKKEPKDISTVIQHITRQLDNSAFNVLMKS